MRFSGQQAREGFGFQFLEFEICDVTPDPAFCPYCPQAWDLGTEQTIVFESDFERRVSLANNWIRLTLTPRAPSVSTFPWPSHTSNTCLFSYYSHFYLYCFFKIIVKRTLKPDRNQNLTWLIDFGLLSSHHIIIISFHHSSLLDFILDCQSIITWPLDWQLVHQAWLSPPSALLQSFLFLF